MKRRLFVATLGLASMIGLAGPAHATSGNVQGDVKSTTTYYSTKRTITANGSNIYLRINNPGVDMKVFWYKCDDRRVRGVDVNFWNSTSPRKLIGSNFQAGTVFCLAAAGDIGEGSFPWTGKADWNVYS
ncbi:hypothetical protein [Streptomyces sp. NBC_01538]|uniref:hypothetical protein n=1 Tax=Streptomyces sp. NBC_01538 TaxID=2903897 RepID=UPI003868A815